MIHFLLHDIIFLLSGFSTMALNLRHSLPLIIFITGLEFLLYAFSLQFIKVPDITLKCGLIIYTFCIYYFICPFRKQPPVSLDLLFYSLLEYNSIPYNFLLKTHILLSFSNHELYCISSLGRLVNISHPKLCYL